MNHKQAGIIKRAFMRLFGMTSQMDLSAFKGVGGAEPPTLTVYQEWDVVADAPVWDVEAEAPVRSINTN